MSKDQVDFIVKALQLLLVGVIIPIVTYLWYKIKFHNFKKMIKKQYVDRFVFEDVGETKKFITELVKRLTYLLENEVKYIKAPNQVSYVRLVEFTRSLAKIEIDVLGTYGFEKPVKDYKSEDKDKVYKHNFNYVKKLYKDNLNKYIAFKTDEIIDDRSKEKLLDSQKQMLEKITNQ